MLSKFSESYTGHLVQKLSPGAGEDVECKEGGRNIDHSLKTEAGRKKKQIAENER